MSVEKGTENLAFENDEARCGKEVSFSEIPVGENNPPNDPPPYSQAIKEPQKEEPPQQERDQWSNPLEFILSCIAMSVGLGNVWRFPATAMENGGGAFLIPYLIVLVLIGRPFYYMELCMGQFASYGCVKIWNVVPAMKGIGYGQLISTWAVLTYYVSLMGITMFYFFASFNSELPWSNCPPNATNCFDVDVNSTRGVNLSTALSASEIYYMNIVTKTYDKGLDDGIFLPDLYLTLSLFGSWLILFIIISRGVKSSGKAAYFMALFPYVVLFGLLAKGLTLPGAYKGIKYFFTPDFSKLLELNVWKAAVGQCFFSLSVGFGSVVMLASYNDFRNNVYRDALIISITDTATSILAGATTFSIMGYLSEEMGLDNVADVLKGGGTTLAFVTYPDVITHLGWYPQVFACSFFLMLFTLGMGSATALTGVVITVICDNLPKLSRFKVTVIVCILGFLLGLFYVTPQGTYILKLIDTYLGEDAIYILAICEIVSVQWIYGYNNFVRDIEFMLGMKMGIYWRFCWVFFTPSALLGILVYSFAKRTPLTAGSYTFGPIANGIAVSMAVISLAIVPAFIIIAFNRARSRHPSALETLKAIFFTPSPKWGPQDLKIKKEYMALTLNHSKSDAVFGEGSYKYNDPSDSIITISSLCNEGKSK